jgi:hypothetical protein
MPHRRKIIATTAVIGIVALGVMFLTRRDPIEDRQARSLPRSTFPDPHKQAATAASQPHRHHHDEDPPPPPVEPDAPAAVSTAPASSDPNNALLEPQKDGSVLIDKIYRLVGKGSPEEPFILRWDMLLSTKDSYNTATGGWDLPPRLKMLEGKTVTLKGYLAVPIISRTADHVLLTWSMMDVCHGVTPKPFQAVEVRLVAPIEIQPHSLAIMTMTGKFRLDPTMRTGWSMVMYMIDDAKLVAVDNPIQ